MRGSELLSPVGWLLEIIEIEHKERLGVDMHAYTYKRGQLTYEWRVVIDAHIRFFHDVARFA
jgi:hypothetical protein